MSSAEVFAMLTKLPTVAAEPIGDASSSRVLIGLVVGLLILGVALLVLAWWVARTTRYQPEALAPLEVMGTRAWLAADDDVKVELLELARPSSPSEPASSGAQPTPVDKHSELKVDTGIAGDNPDKVDKVVAGETLVAAVEPAADAIQRESVEGASKKGKFEVRPAGAAASTPSSGGEAKGASAAAPGDNSDATPQGIEAELTRPRLQKPERSNAATTGSSTRPPTAKSITDSITTGPKRSSSARRTAVGAATGPSSSPDDQATSTEEKSADAPAQDLADVTDAQPDRPSVPGNMGRREKPQQPVKRQATDESSRPTNPPAAPRPPQPDDQAVARPPAQPAAPARPSQPAQPVRSARPDGPGHPAPPRSPRPAPEQTAAPPPQRKPIARPAPGSPEVIVVEQSPVAEVVVIDTAPDSAKAATKVPPPPRPAAAQPQPDKPDKRDKPAGPSSAPIPGEPIL